MSRLILLCYRVDGAQHRSCHSDPLEIGSHVCKCLDDGHLRDGVQIPALVQHQVDMRQRLETPAKPALRLAYPLGDRSQLAVIRGNDDDDAIGFPEGVAAKDDALVVADGHGRRVPRVASDE